MAQMPMPSHDNLWETFQKVDKNKSGRITVTELQQALSNASRTQFKLDTVRLMIRIFDKDLTGSITFQEFKGLWRYVTDWQNCFRTYDRDNSNSIDKGELATALNKFGYHFAPRTITAILEKYTRPGRATIPLDDFIRCCIQLQTMKEAFDKRDFNRDGLLTIKFEQFVQMTYAINI